MCKIEGKADDDSGDGGGLSTLTTNVALTILENHCTLEPGDWPVAFQLKSDLTKVAILYGFLRMEPARSNPGMSSTLRMSW